MITREDAKTLLIALDVAVHESQVDEVTAGDIALRLEEMFPGVLIESIDGRTI